MKHTEMPNEVSKLLDALNDAQKKALGGILDTGHRTEFETGAVRDAAPGRGRCDLLPLGAVANLFPEHFLFFGNLERYVHKGEIRSLFDAITFAAHTMFKESIPTAVLEVAIHFEEGAKKYKERNWEQGIPLHCYIDSAVRHYLKWLRGDDDERHDRAVVWNLLCAAWTHWNKPEMIDLPFAEK